MTPKEKAKDLYNKFRSASRHEYLERTGEAAHLAGKKLALLCVDEIIATNVSNGYGPGSFTNDHLYEVKQEIEKL